MPLEATILIADDEASNHDLLGARLSALRFGGRIASVYDGVQVLEWLRAEGAPLLLFLDLQMPRMTGHDVLARLDAGDVGPPPDVLIISSSERSEDIALPDQYSFVVDYLDKPPSTAALWQAASVASSTRPYLSPPV